MKYKLNDTHIDWSGIPKAKVSSKTCLSEGYTIVDGIKYPLKRLNDWYDIEIHPDKIIVNGKHLPFEYESEYTYKILKNKIKTMSVEGLEKHFNNFGKFSEGHTIDIHYFWFDAILMICKHVEKNGRAICKN